MKTSTIRILTGICLAIVLLPLVFIGSWPMLILILFLTYFACYELLQAYATKVPQIRHARFIFPLLSCSVVLTGYYEPELLMPLVILLIIGVALFSLAFSSDNVLNSYFLLFIFLYTGFGFFSAMKIAYLEPINYPNSSPHAGFYYLLYLYGVIAFTDIGAYMIGRFFGKRKLCPLISPKKTVEGAVGGALFGVLFGTVLYFVFELIAKYHFFSFFDDIHFLFRLIFIVALSLLLSIVGQIGDLVASIIKRTTGIKDFGKLFPGHGGVLDRFDSFLLASMVFYFILVMLGVL